MLLLHFYFLNINISLTIHVHVIEFVTGILRICLEGRVFQ